MAVIQFNYTKHEFTTIPRLVDWLNRQMQLLSRSLRGAVYVDAGNSGAAKTIALQVADMTAVLLTNDVTLTLSMTDTRKGQRGEIEFTQDAIGGRTVTFVNLIGASPAITATADKRTLIRFVHVGDGYVALVIQSNY